ncbi:hypothetical protein GCM10029978_005720 [Actinoallomurus acanthiterrae]
MISSDAATVKAAADSTNQRADRVARFRFRDRRLPREPALPFDDALADHVGEWAHRKGAAAIDAHVAACEALRDELRAGTAHGPWAR